MKTYRVTYQIDVDGEDALDAAQEALDMMTGGDGGTRYTFDIFDKDGHGTRVTLDYVGSQHEVVPLTPGDSHEDNRTPSPEETGEYKCPKCGNTEQFRGVDDKMYGVQDFWIEESGDVDYGTYETDGIGTYSAIYCNSDDGCEALIWPLPTPTE